MPNLKKILSLGADCYMRTDRRTDKHEEVNNLFSQSYERA